MNRAVRLRALAAGAALALAATIGCTASAGNPRPASDQDGTRQETSVNDTTPTPGASGTVTASAPLPGCYQGTGATAHRLPGSTSGRMVALGSGPRGIVFAPISWGDACEWAAEAKRLARHGHQVVTFDWGDDREETVLAATALLRGRGAGTVAWVGGCMGGTVMLGLAADRSAERPEGVAGISPLATLGGADAGEGDGYRGELLLLGTERDPLADETRLREVAQRFPAARTTVLPGTLHAAEIFGGPHQEDARTALDAFLGRVFGREAAE
ncbi:alpha/beta hydrolase [Streptomyces sp. NPDC051018]|uniref:alpha/beta hydrolase n=1 Tax=Streptomyces sp. NPDC051018 TaxID=3365639 RepID=UPI0037BDFD18